MSLPGANDEYATKTSLFRRNSIGNAHEILADIYSDDINIAIWQRDLSEPLMLAATNILDTKSTLQAVISVTPDNAYTTLYNTLGRTQHARILSEDIAQLVDMFCCLLNLKSAGLRLTALDRAMCPRFHVDRVECRLVTTYQGVATEWLPHHLVDRSKLGTGNQDKPDEVSGLFESATEIKQLSQGDVALLKGEHWQGNEGAGLVHRSPKPANNTQRLLLTLDSIYD